MTFVLAVANNEFLIQLSDRRVSWNGEVVEDESNKAGHVYCDDAQVVYAYCGLARWRNFETGRWILEALRAGSGNDRSLQGVLDGFARMATITFQSNPVLASAPPQFKRLSVQFTGHLRDGQLICVLITNYQDVNSGNDSAAAWEEFRVYVETLSPSKPYSFIQRIGAWQALTSEDEALLRQMLIERVPRGAMLDKGVSLIRNIAERPRAQGLIGKQINSACLTPDTSGPISGYHSMNAADTIPLIDQIDLRTGGLEIEIAGLTLSVPGTPIVFASTKRKHPCPCGSGKKYKHCHGRR